MGTLEVSPGCVSGTSAASALEGREACRRVLALPVPESLRVGSAPHAPRRDQALLERPQKIHPPDLVEGGLAGS